MPPDNSCPKLAFLMSDHSAFAALASTIPTEILHFDLRDGVGSKEARELKPYVREVTNHPSDVPIVSQYLRLSQRPTSTLQRITFQKSHLTTLYLSKCSQQSIWQLQVVVSLSTSVSHNLLSFPRGPFPFTSRQELRQRWNRVISTPDQNQEERSEATHAGGSCYGTHDSIQAPIWSF